MDELDAPVPYWPVVMRARLVEDNSLASIASPLAPAPSWPALWEPFDVAFPVQVGIDAEVTP